MITEGASEINVVIWFHILKRFIHHQESPTDVIAMPQNLGSSLARATAFGVGALLHSLVYRKGEWDLAIPKVLSSYGMYLGRVLSRAFSNIRSIAGSWKYHDLRDIIFSSANTWSGTCWFRTAILQFCTVGWIHLHRDPTIGSIPALYAAATVVCWLGTYHGTYC
jgi:hypothetical protein